MAVPFEYNTKQRLILAIVPRVASTLIRLLCATLRYEDIIAPGVITGYDQKPPGVYAFWHRSLLICADRFKNWDIAILISRSFDGEIIARTVEQLGFTVVRGSSSRGGAVALRQMAEAYAAGHWCAITADGPRGPSQVAKPGAAQLAELVGATEVGVFYALPDRAWTLKTWDRFLIPKPFAKVTITWPGMAEPNLPAIQTKLDRAVAMAEPPLK
jgi:lysophospholipid acyltransferase (LPLAT)-like uncharacterized protein